MPATSAETIRPVNESSLATSKPTSSGSIASASHVGHDPPSDLEHREPSVGGSQPHVSAERDLAAATERDAMDHGDDWALQLLPAA